jgi:hypothetical protein
MTWMRPRSWFDHLDARRRAAYIGSMALFLVVD